MVPRRRRVDRRSARGTVMVLFAMVTVVLLGMLALVIEVGIVRGGRQRMQAASDAAALEVMRERDWVRPGLGSDDPALRDQDRRMRNRLMASWPFAGDGLAQSYSESAEGAGAYLTLESQGDPGNPMNQGLVLGASGSSIPLLQANDGGNAKYGDIVSGRFTGHDAGAPVGFGGNPIRREESDYDRVDFDPASSGDAPFADSVLVRMRRTVPFGNQSSSPWSSLDVESGVSSSGYTIPLLFGLGTPFTAQDPSAGYSVRHHGLAMRSTSIAQARPAVRVGEARPDLGEEWAVGAAPLSFRILEWNWWESVWIYDAATGQPSATVRIRPPAFEFAVDHDSNIGGYLRLPGAIQVGDLIEPNELGQAPGDPDDYFDESFWTRSECYIPLYALEPLPTGVERRVCGFGRVSIEPTDPPTTGDLDAQEGDIWIKVTKLKNERTPLRPWVAPRNASAVFDGSQAVEVFPGAPQGEDWSYLLDFLFQLPEPQLDPSDPNQIDDNNPFLAESRVYAPALVR